MKKLLRSALYHLLIHILLYYNFSIGLKCKIAKLFAKHFKVQDQVDLLSKQYFPVAVGTPNRLSKLVELGALSLSRVKVRTCHLMTAVAYFHSNTST